MTIAEIVDALKTEYQHQKEFLYFCEGLGIRKSEYVDPTLSKLSALKGAISILEDLAQQQANQM